MGQNIWLFQKERRQKGGGEERNDERTKNGMRRAFCTRYSGKMTEEKKRGGEDYRNPEKGGCFLYCVLLKQDRKEASQ